jgi:hypothetical protein
VEEKYYVYAHYKIGEENIPFYIGKGKNGRAYSKYQRSKHWNNVVEKYGGFHVKILCENMSEMNALLVEKQLIGMFGRSDLGNGPLVNHTDGGEGFSGFIQPPEMRARRIKTMTGRKYDENRRRNIANGKLGNKNPMFGKIGAENPFFGKVLSAESIAKGNETRRRNGTIMNGGKNGNSKSVKTSLGTFGSASEAAKAHNVKSHVMTYWCRNKTNGCEYIQKAK